MTRKKEGLFGKVYGNEQPRAQRDFLNLAPIPPRYSGPPSTHFSADVAAAHDLASLHKAFDDKNEKKRIRILNRDVGKDKREYFKKIGWTDKDRTAAMNGHWTVAMFRLREIGVFDRITQEISIEELTEIIGMIQTYDREHKMTKRKWRQFAIDAGAFMK